MTLIVFGASLLIYNHDKSVDKVVPVELWRDKRQE